MQARKSQYQVYSPMLDLQTKHARNLFESHLPRKATGSDVLGVLFTEYPDYLSSLNLNIFSEEYFFTRTGANTVFPENEVVLNNLLKARFQLNSAEGFSLPFESFMFAIPNGYEVDGVKIPSFLVTWIPYAQTQDMLISPFGKYAKITKPLQVILDEAPLGDMGISICYRDPTQSTAYARTLLSASQIPDLLNAKDDSQFKNDLQTYKPYREVIELSEYDVQIQRIMLRLVAAFGIYNVATEGDRLKPGFPGTLQPKIIGRFPDVPMRSSTLSNGFHDLTQGANAAEIDPIYRTWFFRQLRDEIYYRGEHALKPRGSRFVFIPPTVVNLKVEPHTQT